MSGTGKTTLMHVLAHQIHTASVIPYEVKFFNAEQLSNFKATVQGLSNSNQILCFDDLSGLVEDYGKKATVEAAKKHLAKEYFGEDAEGFKKIARGLMSKDSSGENTGFANNLSKENKDRLDNRLESFYDQHIKPLLK